MKGLVAPAVTEGYLPSGVRRMGTGPERSLRWGLLPALVVLTAVTVGPLLYLFVVSLTPLDLARPATWMDFSDPLAGYRRLWRDARFGNSLVVQSKLSLSTVTLQLGLGLLGALLLNTRGRFIPILRGAFLIPLVLPPIVAAIIWKVLFTPEISPLNWALGLVGLPEPAWLAQPRWALASIVIADVWQWFSFPLLALLAALQIIPPEITDAARIDGASARRLFWHIILPYLRPTLVIVGLFRLIDSLKAFPLIFVLTEGGPGTATEATNFYIYLQGFAFGSLGYGSSMAVLMLGLTLLLALGIVRTLVRPADVE